MLIVISFDGVKDIEFENMAANPKKFPNIAKFKSNSVYTGDVYTAFVSNTYPIHCSIATGKLPFEHGIISNLLDNGEWAQDSRLIQSNTIWEAARKKKLKVASINWPVTAFAKIKYNLPEVHLLKGQNRIIEHMKKGSMLFQLNAFFKHKHKMDGLKEPNLDDFFTSVAVDTIKEKKPNLLLLHLWAYDSLAHEYGLNDRRLDIARKSLDENLGRIMDTGGENATIIVFSDHGHINVSETVNINDLYDDSFEMCGGSCFAKVDFTDEIKNEISEQEWFGRFLTDEEMEVSGYRKKGAPFGIAAKVGYSFSEITYKANHGYPRDYPDYKVFYAIKNSKRKKEYEPKFDDIRNVTALINRELKLKIM